MNIQNSHSEKTLRNNLSKGNYDRIVFYNNYLYKYEDNQNHKRICLKGFLQKYKKFKYKLGNKLKVCLKYIPQSKLHSNFKIGDIEITPSN